MSEAKADTVPGLGFKDKEKALETLKNIDGRDPDYQKLAIKGLIGRAKRTLTLTKAEDKVNNIKDAVKVFEDWLKSFEKSDLARQNWAYLPLATMELLMPLQKKFGIKGDNLDAFLKAYKSADGEYKRLRTVSSEEDELTWDIVRNNNLRDLIESIEDEELWDGDLPTKAHMKVIAWSYSPEASKIKKTLSKIEEKLGKGDSSKEESSPETKKGSKRKSEASEEATPEKKKSSSKKE